MMTYIYIVVESKQKLAMKTKPIFFIKFLISWIIIVTSLSDSILQFITSTQIFKILSLFRPRESQPNLLMIYTFKI